mgnify:CR=1 FL=1
MPEKLPEERAFYGGKEGLNSLFEVFDFLRREIEGCHDLGDVDGPKLLGKAAFFLPGGVGIIEGTMAALYNGLGVPPGVTVVVILGYRVLSFWIPTLLGFPLIVYFQRTTFVGDGG